MKCRTENIQKQKHNTRFISTVITLGIKASVFDQDGTSPVQYTQISSKLAPLCDLKSRTEIAFATWTTCEWRQSSPAVLTSSSKNCFAISKRHYNSWIDFHDSHVYHRGGLALLIQTRPTISHLLLSQKLMDWLHNLQSNHSRSDGEQTSLHFWLPNQTFRTLLSSSHGCDTEAYQLSSFRWWVDMTVRQKKFRLHLSAKANEGYLHYHLWHT